MENKKNVTTDTNKNWLMFFYTVPSKPVNNRMTVWRRLTKAGALHFKESVYLLPYNDEHYELFQWLVSDIIAMNGEAAIVSISNIENTSNDEIKKLFNIQRNTEYQNLEKKAEDIERKLNSLKKSGSVQADTKLTDNLQKLSREAESIKKIDFFSSPGGRELDRKINQIHKLIQGLMGETHYADEQYIIPRKIEDYKERLWITRKKPFVDRMACAWLIKKIIDKEAKFQFIDESEINNVPQNSVLFDIRGAEFTHIKDLCTFEVMVRSFAIKDNAIKKIAEIVHELDINDGKHNNPEANGIEEILSGIKKSIKDDHQILEKGMEIFELIYHTKKT